MHLPFQRYINVITYDDTLTMDMPADTWKYINMYKETEHAVDNLGQICIGSYKKIHHSSCRGKTMAIIWSKLKIETLGNKAD